MTGNQMEAAWKQQVVGLVNDAFAAMFVLWIFLPRHTHWADTGMSLVFGWVFLLLLGVPECALSTVEDTLDLLRDPGAPWPERIESIRQTGYAVGGMVIVLWLFVF